MRVLFFRSGRSPAWLKMKNSDAPAVKHPSLVLKRASASRPSGEWDDDDYDVLADGAVVGRIFNSHAGPVGSQWMWTLAFGHHGGRKLSATMRIARRHTATSLPARPRWRRSLRLGGGSERKAPGLPGLPVGRLTSV
jgi:hypothetical protein